MVCIPLCASILFVLPAGNHTNAIRAFVSYTRVRNHNSKCAPPAGHHRVALSISAPVNKNHCGFQVVFLHFGALLLQSLQHQSSLLLNFLPPGNQLIHIILFVQLSSHCLRIQLPHPQRAFLPIMFLATALLFATAVPLISPYRAARSQHGTFG